MMMPITLPAPLLLALPFSLSPRLLSILLSLPLHLLRLLSPILRLLPALLTPAFFLLPIPSLSPPCEIAPCVRTQPTQMYVSSFTLFNCFSFLFFYLFNYLILFSRRIFALKLRAELFWSKTVLFVRRASLAFAFRFLSLSLFLSFSLCISLYLFLSFSLYKKINTERGNADYSKKFNLWDVRRSHHFWVFVWNFGGG